MFAIILLIAILLILAYNSRFQTFIGKKIIAQFNTETTHFKLKKINLSPFHYAELDGLLVLVNNDTLCYIDKLESEIDFFSFLKKEIKLKETHLHNTYFQLFTESNGTQNLSYLLNLFKTQDTTKTALWHLDYGNVFLDNCRFAYRLENAPANVSGKMNYGNIQAFSINGLVNNLQFSSDSILITAHHLSAKERSNLELTDLSTDFKLKKGKLYFDSLELATERSFLSGNVHLIADNFKKYTRFTDDVTIYFKSDSSVVQLNELTYFSENIPNYNEHVVIKGKIKGSVNRFKSKNVLLDFGSGISLLGDLDISDIQYPSRTFLFVKVKKLYASAKSLQNFGNKLNVNLKIPKNIYKLGLMTYTGTLTGFYSDLVLYGDLFTELGKLTTDISIKQNDYNDLAYSGHLSTKQFNFGRFLSLNNQLKKVAANINIEGQGTSLNTLKAKVNGSVQRVDIQDYVYKNIAVNGNIANGYFKGDFAVKDTNLQMTFNGLIDVKSEIPYFNFDVAIKKADLFNLHLYKDTNYYPVISGNAFVSLSVKNIDQTHGNINIKNLKINDNTGEKIINNIAIIALSNDTSKSYQITSDIINGGITGNFKLNNIYSTTRHLINKYINYESNSTKGDTLQSLKGQLTFTLDTFITKYFIKKRLSIAQSQLLFDISPSFAEVYFSTPLLQYQNTLLYQPTFTVKAEDSLKVNFYAQKAAFSDSVYFNNFSFYMNAKSDSLNSGILWNNNDKNTGNITLTAGYTDNVVKGSFLPSFFYIKQHNWEFTEHNTFEWNVLNNELIIRNLKVENSDTRQSVFLDGTVSKDPTKQLDIIVNEMDLSFVNLLVDEKLIKPRGTLNGNIAVSNLFYSPIAKGDLSAKNLEINDVYLGDAGIHSEWNNYRKVLSLNGFIKYGPIKSIKLSGEYAPYSKRNNYDFKFNFNQTNIEVFAPYIKTVLSDISGELNGNIRMTGKKEHPIFSGNLKVLNPHFKVNYLNTSFSGKIIPLYLVDEFIAADNVTVYDEKNNPLQINLSLYHNNLKNINYDISGITKKAFVLNTNEMQNSLFYGQAVIGGEFDISGDANDLYIDLNIKTLKGTNLNIPIDQTEDIEAFDFIYFTTNDTIQKDTNNQITPLKINLNLLADITEDTELKLIFDKQLGDVIRSKGSGNLKISYINNEFNIFGSYKIHNGDYLFTLQNIINKKFDIESGSKINWNGDVYQGELDITASYKLRTRLYDLLAAYDSSDFYKRRIPVEVKLKMTNTLIEPKIDFAIDLPTADQNTKELVKSTLLISQNNDNNQELNKQVFALLVLNRFLPPPGSTGTYAHSSFVSTSSSELLSNQLSNWLSQLSSDFDIGFNYRPGDELSSQEVNLALSTQLFNDRLIIDGNVGYANNKFNPNGTSALIGDINVEYKLAKDGNLRIKAFNKTNANNYYFFNSPYTQGVGIAYQEEFNTTREFFKKFFGRFTGKTNKQN